MQDQWLNTRTGKQLQSNIDHTIKEFYAFLECHYKPFSIMPLKSSDSSTLITYLQKETFFTEVSKISLIF